MLLLPVWVPVAEFVEHSSHVFTGSAGEPNRALEGHAHARYFGHRPLVGPDAHASGVTVFAARLGFAEEEQWILLAVIERARST